MHSAHATAVSERNQFCEVILLPLGPHLYFCPQPMLYFSVVVVVTVQKASFDAPIQQFSEVQPGQPSAWDDKDEDDKVITL